MPTAAATIASVKLRPHGELKGLETELRLLVNRVADYHGYTLEQRQVALNIALAYPQPALEYFRALVWHFPH